MDREAVLRLWWRGELRAAVQRSDELIANAAHPFRDRDGSLDDAARLHDHGARCWHNARFADAARALDRAYDIRRSVLGDGHVLTAASLERLGGLASYTREPALARTRFAAAIACFERVDGGKRSVRAAIARRNLAALERDQGELKTARAVLEDARRTFRRDVADDDPEQLAFRKVDAMIALREGDAIAAIRMIEDAIERALPALPSDHPFIAAGLLTCASAELKLERPEAARDLIDTVLPSFERGYGDHPLLAIALHLGARAEADLDDQAAAAALARRSLTMYMRFYPLAAATFTTVTLLTALVKLGRFDEADALATDSFAAADSDRAACSVAGHYGSALLRVRRIAVALDWMRRARERASGAEQLAKLDTAIATWSRWLAAQPAVSPKAN